MCRDNDIGVGNERSYWAKGTGFGTGSTSSGWDVEQAMLKQKAEEEHVTCLLQVSAGELTTRELHTNQLVSRCHQFKLTIAWLSQLVGNQHATRGPGQTISQPCLVDDCKTLWVLKCYLHVFHFESF